jgi:hypothetical protein
MEVRLGRFPRTTVPGITRKRSRTSPTWRRSAVDCLVTAATPDPDPYRSRQVAGAAAAGSVARLVAPRTTPGHVATAAHRQAGAGKRHRIPFPPLLRSALFVHTAASARPGPGAKVARSRSDSPPHTPYRSPYWIA